MSDDLEEICARVTRLADDVDIARDALAIQHRCHAKAQEIGGAEEWEHGTRRAGEVLRLAVAKRDAAQPILALVSEVRQLRAIIANGAPK